jgi:tetratricopeptide (TPR) repeat protein
MDIQRSFEILEIKIGASLDDAKKARNDLVFVWHPDRFSSENPRLKQKAEEKLKEINAAYESVVSFLSAGYDLRNSEKSDSNGETSPPQPYSETSTDAEAYFRRGIVLGEAEDHRQAIKCFTQVIQLKPDDPNAYYNRGVAHNKIGNYKRAIKDFTETVRLDANYSIAYIYRGYIYAELDCFDLACEDFQKAYELGNSIGIEWAKRRGICL